MSSNKKKNQHKRTQSQVHQDDESTKSSTSDNKQEDKIVFEEDMNGNKSSTHVTERPVKRVTGVSENKTGDEDDDDMEFEDGFEDEEAEEVRVEEEEQMDTEIVDANAEALPETQEEVKQEPQRVWRPGVDTLGTDEKLDYDSKAYHTFHQMKVEWPCLTFDILRDSLGMNRTKFPLTCYLAAGTQADTPDKNKIMLLKLSELHRTTHDDVDSDEEDEIEDDDNPDDLDDDPILESKFIRHDGGVNRLRSMPQHPNILATWSDIGSVFMWDAGRLISSFDTPPAQRIGGIKPIYSFRGHNTEGYSMDWSPTVAGRFLSGDCAKNIYLWNPNNSSWKVDPNPFRGHSQSVEDIQWSPVEPEVFATCSVDRTVRIWDTRTRDKSMLFVAAHKQDVNVISWNRIAQHLLVSGSDDGSFKIWDLRKFVSTTPAAHFKWHKGAITSVEWHPQDESCLVVSSADNSTTIWDMGLEGDPDVSAEERAKVEGMDIPPQLMFVHQGQTNPKEVHFHPQIPSFIISTAEDGFHFFKPFNMDQTLKPVTSESKSDASSMPPPTSAPSTTQTQNNNNQTS